jgi:hypothetical protein
MCFKTIYINFRVLILKFEFFHKVSEEFFIFFFPTENFFENIYIYIFFSDLFSLIVSVTWILHRFSKHRKKKNYSIIKN